MIAVRLRSNCQSLCGTTSRSASRPRRRVSTFWVEDGSAAGIGVWPSTASGRLSSGASTTQSERARPRIRLPSAWRATGTRRRSEPGNSGDVRLPADPEHREPFFHQEAIAPVGGVLRVEGGAGRDVHRASIQRREAEAAAAIRDVEEADAAALLGIDGLQHDEVGARLDEALGIAGREPDVGHARIGLALRIEAEANLALDHLVGAGRRRTSFRRVPESASRSRVESTAAAAGARQREQHGEEHRDTPDKIERLDAARRAPASDETRTRTSSRLIAA